MLLATQSCVTCNKFTVSGHACGENTKADLSELLTHCTDNWSTEWESIGIKLGLSPQKLQVISVNRHYRVNDCCREMLIQWMKSVPNTCYCKLVTALYELNLKEAACKLAEDKLTKLNA